jgi:hypothetical protein
MGAINSNISISITASILAKRYTSRLLLKESKAIPVTGHGGPWGDETSRHPHFLDNPLTVGSEVFRLICWPPLLPQEDSWYSFLLEAQAHSKVGGISSTEIPVT